ncbi:MAG: 50S ribosomal protein L18 [Clostridiales Family XIII bacterium]|jgi:large subunit ribosomal protein L18|nr:50S ribosomal protein L18 [Clostridiales Family XIII bacterium]
MAKIIKNKNKKEKRAKRRKRANIVGTASKPRLSVFRSARHIYAQGIDDAEGKTIFSASSIGEGIKNGGNIESAAIVGKAVAKKALEKNIKEIAFDRGGFLYHGRIKALADGAREEGLKF